MDANVGDAIEEFMHYAEELKHHVAKGEKHRCWLPDLGLGDFQQLAFQAG
jgi:hypothetical protein